MPTMKQRWIESLSSSAARKKKAMDLNSIDEGDFGLLLGGSGGPSSRRPAGAPRPKGRRPGAKAKRVSLDGRQRRRRPLAAAADTSASARPRERARADEPSSSSDDSDDDDAAISSLRSSGPPRRGGDGAPPPAAAPTRDGLGIGRGKKRPGPARQLGMRPFLSGAGAADDSAAEERRPPARGGKSISQQSQRPGGKRANPFITAGAALVQSVAVGDGPSIRARVPVDRVRGAFGEDGITDSDDDEETSWFDPADPAAVGIRVGKRTRLDPEGDGDGGERTFRSDNGSGPSATDGAPRRSPDGGGDGVAVRDAEERHRRGLNGRVFGLRHGVVGHRLPALDPDRGGGHRALSPAELLSGGGGISSVPSLLFRRSCLPHTPGVAAGLAGLAARAGGRLCRGRAAVRLAVPPGSGDATALSFDGDGVLLASGDGRGNVWVYDFDDVRSADVSARNGRSRGAEWDLRDGDDDEEDGDGDGHEQEGPDLSSKGDVQDSEGPSEPLDDAANLAEVREEPDETDPTEEEAAAPPHEAVPVEPLLSFRCKAGASVSRILWSPDHQDHLAVAFANDPTGPRYDVGAARVPPPCLRRGDARQSPEGVLSVIFLTPSAGTATSSVLVGGSRGTARLWTFPRPRRGLSLSSVSPRLVWSVSPLKDRGEGVGSLLQLPSRPAGSAPKGRKLVLAAGLASSLVLLDAGKVTRKAFSTAVTPTVVASWDVHRLVCQEMSRLVAGGVDMPSRGWTGINAMRLVDHHAEANGSDRYRISMVTRSGWLLSADLATDERGAGSATPAATLRIGVSHHPPRIRVYSSDGRRLGSAGGMALRFSLPEHPVASSFVGRGVWMADVRGLRYTMPSKDKYVLCERHGAVTAETSDRDASRRAQGEGLVLLDARGCLTRTEGGESDGEAGEHVLARLPLADNNPICLEQHPGGEFVVVSYRANSSTTRMELVHLRKLP